MVKMDCDTFVQMGLEGIQLNIDDLSVLERSLANGSIRNVVSDGLKEVYQEMERAGLTKDLTMDQANIAYRIYSQVLIRGQAIQKLTGYCKGFFKLTPVIKGDIEP